MKNIIIGNQDSFFWFSWWPVTSFSVTLQVWRRRWQLGVWTPDKSNPIRYPMLNLMGWRHEGYRIVRTLPALWKPVWSIYYGVIGNQPFYFSVQKAPWHDFRLTPDEEKRLADRAEEFRSFIPDYDPV